MKKLILLSVMFVFLITGLLFADMQSDIREIKRTMVTREEFKMFVEMVNKRFEFIQGLLIALVVLILGSTVYSIVERRGYLTISEFE